MAMDNPSYFSVSNEESLERDVVDRFPRRHFKLSTGSSTESTSPLPLPSFEFFGGKVQHPEYSDVLSRNHYLVPNGGQSPRTDATKRSFRSLLRSLSANAASTQDAQSILLGEPRPADIAPADHCSSFRPRRFAHSRNASDARHSPRKKNHSLNENEEVFYTMPLSGNGRRRHSIGAYLTRDKTPSKNLLKVTSVPSEVPKVDAPKITNDGSPVCQVNIATRPAGKIHPITTLHCSEPPLPISTILGTSSQKKKRPKCPSFKEMENIVMISCKESPEAGLWVDYLTTCFNKMMSEKARQHYKIVSMHIEDITQLGEDDAKMQQLSKAKLQLIVICPKMLNYAEHMTSDAINALAILQSEKLLAMLLGMDENSIKEIHKKAFRLYESWQRVIMKEHDSGFIDNFLSIAVDILSKKQRNNSESTSFSIIPKKIKPGQNRVIALLNEPLTSQDVITVNVEKRGELLQIKSFKKRNPYTLQFDVPDCCLEVSMLIWIKIEKNGIPCGSRQIKCESRLRELDQILRASDNPLEFMCQTLGFKTTDRDQLDSWMLTAFQKNIPPHFNLLTSPLQPTSKINCASVDEYPTLLHFAARFGLERLCWQLLECPGGEAACDTRNVRHLTPADLAQGHGFPEIATVLRGFMQMSEFSNMYYYLKNMSEDPTTTAASLPRDQRTGSIRRTQKKVLKICEPISPETNPTVDPFSEECLQRLESKHSESKIMKAPTNTIPELLYENDSCNSNSILNDSSIQRALENDYLIQPSNRKVEVEKLAFINRPNQIDLNASTRSATDFVPPINSSKTSSNQDSFEPKIIYNFPMRSNSLTSTVCSPSHDNHSAVTPTGQDELAEIIKDFKNNVFTISEVEKLVLDWRNRNETQQSLKEKQEQLNKMREEYDKLQRRIKDDMKRPTPFERVKKIFSKGKSKGGKNASESTTNSQRPNSGLSVHSISSSSSGRLSTASGVSIGESGTQSDNEDIKMFSKINGMQDVAANRSISSADNHDFDNYLIPPPPRPFINNFDNKIAQSCLPNVGHMRDFTFKTTYQMDTINEREASVSYNGCENNVCSSAAGKNQFTTAGNVSEHNYINMSPA